jgi:hypothetical protein
MKDDSLFEVTPAVLGVSLLVAAVLAFASWCWLVLHRSAVPEPQWLVLVSWMRFAWTPELRWLTLQSLVQGIAPVGFVLYLAGNWGPSDKARVLRGARLVDVKALAARTRLKKHKGAPSQVELAGVPIPLGCEPTHFLLAGSTNTGKSTAVDELLATALARGDRCIVVDPNGHALARFGRKGDRVLNPFDKRCPGWSPFNEIRKPFDFERVAASIVPDSADASAQQWHGYARQLLAETMRAMMQSGENSTERLLYWLTQATAKDLGAFLAGSAAVGLFEPGAEKALASTRFILSSHVSCYQHLRPGDFSLRTWLESGKGNLYLTWREDMLSSLKPLVSGWVDILIAAILTLPEGNPRPLWLVLDELASLERLSSLEAGLTKGRKHGLRVVAGLQSVAQLDDLYGGHAATTLRSCLRNLLVLGCANTDPETAKVFSDGLGQSEVERTQLTHNSARGNEGGTTSRSVQRSVEPLVLPSQLTSLAPLDGYLKFAGDFPVAKIRLQPGNHPVRNKPFLEV